MKKRYLKKWVEVLLLIVLLTSMIILGAECSDTKIFIESKIIALILIISSSYLLFTYGRLEKRYEKQDK